MKNLSIGILSIFFLGFLMHLVAPWWVMAPVAGLVALVLGRSPAASFGIGFAAASLLWSSYATWLDWSNASILSQQMGVLFQGLTGAQLVLITGALGGLVGGLGALTGSLGGKLIRSK